MRSPPCGYVLGAVICLLFSLSSWAEPSQEPQGNTPQLFHSSIAARLDRVIETNERPFYGIVMLMQAGKVIYQRSHTPKEGQAVTPHSRFLLASQSKMISAAIVLNAVAEGKLALDAGVNDYLAQAGQAKYAEGITIAQLLSHTSGIAPQGRENRFVPGSQFQYSNLGYQVLAQVLAIQYQRPFATLVNDFLAKAGVGELHAQLGAMMTLPNADPFAVLPGIDMGEGETVDYQIVPELLAGGGMTGSAHGLLSYLQALHEGKLLPKTMYQLMTTPRVLRPHRWQQLYYGFGVQVSEQEVAEYSHSGYLPGYQSLSLSYPDSHTYLVILENASWPLDDMQRVFGLHDKLRQQVRAYVKSQGQVSGIRSVENKALATGESRL